MFVISQSCLTGIDGKQIALQLRAEESRRNPEDGV